MEAHQLLKLPALFKHLAEHRSDSPTSWAGFIAEHYVQGGHHPDRGHHHGDLPFQSDNHCAGQSIKEHPPEDALASLVILNSQDLGLTPADERVPSGTGLSDVWQPPRP